MGGDLCAMKVPRAERERREAETLGVERQNISTSAALQPKKTAGGKGKGEEKESPK